MSGRSGGLLSGVDDHSVWLRYLANAVNGRLGFEVEWRWVGDNNILQRSQASLNTMVVSRNITAVSEHYHTVLARVRRLRRMVSLPVFWRLSLHAELFSEGRNVKWTSNVAGCWIHKYMFFIYLFLLLLFSLRFSWNTQYIFDFNAMSIHVIAWQKRYK